MFEEAKELDFSDNALSIDEVFESFRDLFDRDFTVCLAVDGRDHDSVGSDSDLLDVFVFLLHMEGGAGDDERMLPTVVLDLERAFYALGCAVCIALRRGGFAGGRGGHRD